MSVGSCAAEAGTLVCVDEVEFAWAARDLVPIAENCLVAVPQQVPGVGSTIRTAEPDAFERSIDMIRKLRDTGGYTATSLLLVEWEAAGEQSTVRARPDLVPDDVAPPQFFTAMIDRVLSVAPVTFHVGVRERRERRSIPVIDDDAEPARDR